MRRYLIPPVAQAARAVAVPFAVTRAAVLVAGIVGALLPAVPEVARPSALDAIGHLFERWDTAWYVRIALHGYAWNGNALQMQDVVFFPMLPILMRAAGFLAAGRLALAGAIVSLIAFFGACVQTWRLAVAEFTTRTDVRTAERLATTAVVLLCAYPFAVYYGIAYTESLFLVFAVSAFVAARQRAWMAAAMFGLLTALTRPNGLVLAAPLAWLAFVDEPVWRPEARRHLAARLLATAAPAVGTLLFSVYLQWAVGDALAWYKGQAAWHWIAPEAKADVVAALKTINAADLYVGFVSVCPGLFALFAIGPIAFALGPAYALFVAANIVPPILTHGFMSAGRFTSVLFPLFLWIAWTLRGDRERARALAAVGLTAEVVVSALFFAGWPMV